MLSENCYKLNTNNYIPKIGLGTWLSKGVEAYSAVRDAINAGYQHIDCAARYGNEEIIGRAIYDAIKNGDVKRENLFITSKLWNDSHLPQDVRPAFETSLKRLKCDYLDLYLMHWPVATEKETNIPISLKKIPLNITYNAMQELYYEGLTKAIGTANFSIKKLEYIKKTCNVLPAINQVEVNLYFQQPELIKYCDKNNIIITASAPLSSQSRLVKPEGEKNPFEDEIVIKLAKKYNCTKAQLILAFLLSKKIVIIPKSTNKNRIIENLNSLKIKLEPQDIILLTSLNINRRVFPGQGMIKGDYTYENLWDEKYNCTNIAFKE